MEGGVEEEERVNIGVLLKAMNMWVEFYHQSDKNEFYAIVAEAYGTLFPAHVDVTLGVIEKYETMMKKIAAQSRQGNRPQMNEYAVISPLHLPGILAFYETVGVVDNASQAAGQENLSPPLSQQTADGGDSTVTTKLEDLDADAANGELEDATEAPTDAAGAVVTKQEITNHHRRAPLDDPLNQHEAIEMVRRLTHVRAEAERKYNEKLALVQAEKLRVEQAKQTYKRYKAVVKEYRLRDKERKRIERLMEGGGGDAVVRGASLQDDRKALRKERKRLERLKHDLQMQYKLLESENLRFKMKVENEMAALRRDYADSYLFPGMTLP